MGQAEEEFLEEPRFYRDMDVRMPHRVFDLREQYKIFLLWRKITFQSNLFWACCVAALAAGGKPPKYGKSTIFTIQHSVMAICHNVQPVVIYLMQC